ncbi:MAG TPA: hypothetical protein VGV59_20795 [Pyrinomonadaceae bacterium]|nr:hypothetical protein [Pyrinomonadaceae bacterium]
MSTAIIDTRLKWHGRLHALVKEFRRRDALLFWTGAAPLLLVPLMLAVAPFDERLVTGINPWIKPIKFTVAGAVYLLTLAWFMPDVPASTKARQRVSKVAAFSMLAELALVMMQAARGTSSHFNERAPFDAAVFAMMGLLIMVNTVAVGYVTWRFWRADAQLPAPYLWGLRFGLLFFILAGFEGFAMVRLKSHSVGVADGGPGLPFLNWSTKGGDLRAAHFIGLHALQVLPLVGYLFSSSRLTGRIKNPTRWVWTISMMYAGLSLLLFLQALSGSPLLSY